MRAVGDSPGNSCCCKVQPPPPSTSPSQDKLRHGRPTAHAPRARAPLLPPHTTLAPARHSCPAGTTLAPCTAAPPHHLLRSLPRRRDGPRCRSRPPPPAPSAPSAPRAPSAHGSTPPARSKGGVSATDGVGAQGDGNGSTRHKGSASATKTAGAQGKRQCLTSCRRLLLVRRPQQQLRPRIVVLAYSCSGNYR